MGLTRVPVLQNVGQFIGKSAVTLVSSKWQNPPWHPCMEFNQVRKDWLNWISPNIFIQKRYGGFAFWCGGNLGWKFIYNSYTWNHNIQQMNLAHNNLGGKETYHTPIEQFSWNVILTLLATMRTTLLISHSLKYTNLTYIDFA